MIDLKEKVENIQPLEGQVKVKIKIPKEFVTESGIILTSQRDKVFKEADFYNVEVLEVGKGCPKDVQVAKVYRVDKFAGTAIPTEGEDLIKVIPHDLLLGEDSDNPEEFNPHEDRLLVKVTSQASKTKGGVIAPGNSGDIFETDTLGGEIIALSDNLTKEYKVGDKIRWESHAGYAMEFKGGKDGEDYRSIQKFSILCKIR